MKKLFTLMLASIACTIMNAKTFETTLWEDTYTDGVELNSETVTTFTAGNTLRIYVTVPEGGANFKIVYKGESNSWTETDIPSLNTQWPWVNGGETHKDITLTAEDITALSGMNIYIYKNNDYPTSTINKVILYGEVSTSGETELLSENKTFTGSWEWADFSAQSDAKIGDVIRLTYTADDSSDWPYVQFQIKDSSNENLATFADSKEKSSVNTYDYEITNATDLVKIQTGGFKITGTLFTLTSAKLLTYSDSYDAVPITIGADGMATYSNGSKNIQISACDGIDAYYASAVATGSVTMTKLTECIPASQGVVVVGEAGTYDVPVGGDGWIDISESNYLKATGDNEVNLAASTEGEYRYIFAKNGSDIGFYYLSSDYTLEAHRAYLVNDADIRLSGENARLVLQFSDEVEDTTAIQSVTTAPEHISGIYNLSGQQITKPTKGLNIINGKKGRR